MAVDLTTPEVVPDIEYQGITKMDFHFPHFSDSGDGDKMKLSKANIIVVFEVTTWAGDGTIISSERKTANFPDWPAAFVTDVRAVYSRLEAYAIAQGYIGDGTGEVL